jgi:hypothetical protein
MIRPNNPTTVSTIPPEFIDVTNAHHSDTFQISSTSEHLLRDASPRPGPKSMFGKHRAREERLILRVIGVPDPAAPTDRHGQVENCSAARSPGSPVVKNIAELFGDRPSANPAFLAILPPKTTAIVLSC